SRAVLPEGCFGLLETPGIPAALQIRTVLGPEFQIEGELLRQVCFRGRQILKHVLWQTCGKLRREAWIAGLAYTDFLDFHVHEAGVEQLHDVGCVLGALRNRVERDVQRTTAPGDVYRHVLALHLDDTTTPRVGVVDFTA